MRNWKKFNGGYDFLIYEKRDLKFMDGSNKHHTATNKFFLTLYSSPAYKIS